MQRELKKKKKKKKKEKIHDVSNYILWLVWGNNFAASILFLLEKKGIKTFHVCFSRKKKAENFNFFIAINNYFAWSSIFQYFFLCIAVYYVNLKDFFLVFETSTTHRLKFN